MFEADRNGFEARVEACANEIRAWLPIVTHRHAPLVVVAALSEHVGGALRLCQQAGTCTPAQAQAVLKRLEEITFALDDP